MPKNVQSIIDDLQSGLAELRMHFESLGSIFGGAEKAAPRGRKGFTTTARRADPYKNFKFRAKKGRKVRASAPAKKARKKMKMSPALRKQRQLQGRYMGMIRRLPKAKQDQVKKVRQEKGYAAALKMMG